MHPSIQHVAIHPSIQLPPSIHVSIHPDTARTPQSLVMKKDFMISLVESGPQISVTDPVRTLLWSLNLLLSKDTCFISFQLIVSMFVLMMTSCDITLASLYLLSVPSGLQSPAGPQHPRGQGAGLLWSLLRCGVPLSRARLGPEHLFPG